MESDSDNESIEGDVNIDASNANWGKAKHDYYYTDYVDKDYPSKLSAKEERLAAIEQEEALRIQKKLFATLDNIVDIEDVFEDDAGEDQDLISFIENQNNSITGKEESKKRKRVAFEDEQIGSAEEDFDEGDDDGEEEDEEDDEDDEEKDVDITEQGRRRRPINMAMKKNRGLTPYKKKEYRNPRVKHKLKYKRAMSKRRRNVKEAQPEYNRYSGEATGIKTSTVKSIRLC